MTRLFSMFAVLLACSCASPTQRAATFPAVQPSPSATAVRLTFGVPPTPTYTAGITGLVAYPSKTLILTNASQVITNQEGPRLVVDFSITDATGTNVTTLYMQGSPNMSNWVDLLTSPVVITGSVSGAISDYITNSAQFYRLRLPNFLGVAQ